MKYVYTKKAEDRARKLGLDERKAGAVAKCGHQEITGGYIARAWLAKGYIKKVEG